MSDIVDNEISRANIDNVRTQVAKFTDQLLDDGFDPLTIFTVLGSFSAQVAILYHPDGYDEGAETFVSFARKAATFELDNIKNSKS